MPELGTIRLPEEGQFTNTSRTMVVDTGRQHLPAGRFHTLDDALRSVIASGVLHPEQPPWSFGGELVRYHSEPLDAAVVLDRGTRFGAHRFAVHRFPLPDAVAAGLDKLPPAVLTFTEAPSRWWATRGPEPRRSEQRSPGGVVALAFRAGRDIYVEDLGAEDPEHGRTWIRLSRMREIYAAPARHLQTQTRLWRDRLTHVPGLESDLDLDGSLAYLRSWLAARAADTLPVHNVRFHGRRTGAQVSRHLATSPLPPAEEPLEPSCYLLPMSRVEGKLESINAYDARAGISIGPVQINVTGGHVLQFLTRLWRTDRRLFRAAFARDAREAIYWEVVDDDHPVLRVHTPQIRPGTKCAPTSAWTIADLDAVATRINAVYFQCGRVCPDLALQTGNLFGSALIDLDFRRDLAERMRDVVAWPHVQDLMAEACNDYLSGGLHLLHTGSHSLPSLTITDVASDRQADWQQARDLFKIKTALLSAYTRYAGALRSLLEATGRDPVATRVQRLRRLTASQQTFNQALPRGVRSQPASALADLRRRTREPLGHAGDEDFETMRGILRALRPRDGGGAPTPSQ